MSGPHARSIRQTIVRSQSRSPISIMSILLLLIPISLLVVIIAGWAFFWAVGNGQFDDLESPGWDVLRDDEPAREQKIEDK